MAIIQKLRQTENFQLFYKPLLLPPTVKLCRCIMNYSPTSDANELKMEQIGIKLIKIEPNDVWSSLTTHQMSLYITPNYLMENRKQSKAVQAYINLTVIISLQIFTKIRDLHICLQWNQINGAFILEVCVFDSSRRFTLTVLFHAIVFSGLNVSFREKIVLVAHFNFRQMSLRHISVDNRLYFLYLLLISTRKSNANRIMMKTKNILLFEHFKCTKLSSILFPVGSKLNLLYVLFLYTHTISF